MLPVVPYSQASTYYYIFLLIPYLTIHVHVILAFNSHSVTDFIW